MKYRVNLVRTVRQFGRMDVEAASEQEAREWAMRVADLPGVVVDTPEWTNAQLGPVEVINVSGDAA